LKRKKEKKRRTPETSLVRQTLTLLIGQWMRSKPMSYGMNSNCGIKINFTLNNKNHTHLELYLSRSVIVVEFGLWPVFYINIFLGLFFFIWSWIFFMSYYMQWRLVVSGIQVWEFFLKYVYINYDYLCMWLLINDILNSYVRDS
jgi:hypothetical protein